MQSMRRTFLLLSNRHAGLASSNLVDATIACLRARGVAVEHRMPDSIDAARALAREAAGTGGYDAVVAAGGDGTIRQIAAALLGTTTPLAIVPGGTGNVLAHEMGLVRTPHAIADMLMHGRAVRLAVPRANGEPFLLMAGAGLDARVLHLLDTSLKGRVGKAAYTLPLLEALTHPLESLSVHVDRVDHEASWAIIANSQHYGGPFVLTRTTDVTRHGLVAVLFKTRSRAMLMTQIVSLARGQLDARARNVGDVAVMPCTHARIDAPGRPVPTQLDGDVFGTTPLDVVAGSDEIQLLVPANCSLR
jgi:diacylglycerol kinase family enzyme